MPKGKGYKGLAKSLAKKKIQRAKGGARRRAGAADSAAVQERLRVEREMGMRRGKKK